MQVQPGGLPFVRELAAHGGRTALVHGDLTLSYAELADRVRGMASSLGGGRRLVLVVGAHDTDLVTGYLAALTAGHVVLLVPGGRHVQRWIDRYDPDVILEPGGGDPRSSAPRVTERRPGTVHDLHPELALLLTTSGSTGSARLVRLSYDAVQANAASIVSYLDLGPDDVGITTLPMAYCYGLSVLHSHLLAGAAVVLTETSVVDRCFWDLARRHGVSSLAGVPYTFDLLDRTGFLERRLPTLPRLRRLLQAGGALPVEQAARYAQRCADSSRSFFAMYGQTEATARMAYLPPHLAVERAGALGVAVPGGELTLAEDGELVYRGPNVMLGYADAAGDLALGRTVTELRTGDRGRRRPDGLLELVGRAGRQVKLFGLRVDLDQVEAGLAELGLRAACVADEGRLAAVTEQDGKRVRRAACAATGLPPHAVRAVVVDRLPRTANGKVDRLGAERAASRSVTDPARSSGDHGENGDQVRRLYADVLGVAVGPRDTFVGLGGDSLSYVEVSLRLGELLGDVPSSWPQREAEQLQRLVPSAAPTPGRARPIPAPGRTRPIRTSARARPFRTSGRVGSVFALDTTVLLRAVAILLVVASHVHLSPLLGGAHVLLAVAGYNLARFRVVSAPRRVRVLGAWRSIGRLAAPTVVVVAAASFVTPGVGVVQVAALTSLLGPDVLGPAWRYWFLEALLQLLVLVAVLLAVPAVDRWERRRPLGLPLALLAAGLLTRTGLVGLGAGPDATQSAAAVLWLFALGWCAARVTGLRHRLALSAAAALLVPGFFGQPVQEAVVLTGVLLLVWRCSVPFPRRLATLRPVLGALASSSLFVYLVHWQVLDLMRGAPAVLVLSACLLAGWLASQGWERLVQALRTVVSRTTGPRGWPARASSRSVARYPTSRSTWSRNSQPMLTAAAASGTEPPYAASSGTRMDRNSTQPSAKPAITEPVPNAPQSSASTPGLSGASAR